MTHRHNFIITLGFIFILVLVNAVTTFGVNNQILAKKIDFVNADLRDVFRGLAQAGKLNVVLEPTVRGEVTISLQYGVTIKDAISVIAKTYGYTCRWLADTPTVIIGNSKFSRENFDHKSARVFQLKFADPVAVAESLEVVIPKTRINVDSKMNQITVTACDEEIDNITEIISELDREMPTINIETKLEEVTDQFWKEIGVDNTFSPPHMAVYLLTEQQLGAIEGNPKINLLSNSNLTSLDNHEGKIFIGDKVPLITEKTKQGDINYKVEYVDVGNTLYVTPWINPANKLTITVKILVNTITNKSQPGKNWIPWVVPREFESTISLEKGQAFLLSGLFQRSEYNMMKDSPYKFPVLNELFAKENPSLPTVPNSQTEVVVLITPTLPAGLDQGQANQSGISQTGVLNNPGTDSQNVENQNPNVAINGQSETTAGLYDKQPIEEEKTEIKIGVVKNATTDLLNPVQTQTNTNLLKFTEIKYLVKNGDSLGSIVKKFGSSLQVVVEKNKLGKNGTIKPGRVLIIPVPSERIYVLKPQETLWRIAKRYGTTLAVLQDLNGIANVTKVKSGQQLVLPVPVSKTANPQY